ncbi:tetratricopeptide repeat protein [Acanthopleuribacter pedis]|uniref:Tetratricopeptide repeat protein n=1 Tax=Acanthopleuribacter pedis TaxID=442870 RepID=A0A8J7U5S1_9BACT|nr:tetratricopeptide repeat protein [Acanthopleuribacter pedis]MBO1321149.1 tetratricopeptide repeat protein [Acanthopleuribacter pedis]
MEQQSASSSAKFCPACGAAREPGASFCHQCGTAFAKSGESQRAFFVVAALVLVLSGLVFFYVEKIYDPQFQTSPAHHAHDGHDHDDHDGHDHGPLDNARMRELKAAAASGNAADLILLAEYQIERSMDDPPYLRQAAQSLEKVVELYPTHAYSLRLLGNIYFQLKEPELSSKNYLRYLRVMPTDANALTDLGTQYLAMGRTDTAIESYQHALKLFPNLYHAQFNLSVAYTELGDEVSAEEARQAANDIERRVGKIMAPVPEVSRLPEGLAVRAPASDGPFSALRTYFAEHPIIGPKMVDFNIEDKHATLVLSNFPMEQMPPFAREKFDTNVKTQLAALEGAELTIRDADGNKVLATYTN